MSENIQNIDFEVLNSKMPKSLIFSGFLSIFTPEWQKCIFLAFLTNVNLFDPGNEWTIVQHIK
jgi:hypothetical protein